MRQSLGRSNGWLMVGLNNEATCNSETDLSQNCHRIGEQPKRAKQLSFSATGSLQKCLKMHRHLLSHCWQANSHSFGRIKEIVPLLAKELGGCVWFDKIAATFMWFQNIAAAFMWFLYQLFTPLGGSSAVYYRLRSYLVQKGELSFT